MASVTFPYHRQVAPRPICQAHETVFHQTTGLEDTGCGLGNKNLLPQPNLTCRTACYTIVRCSKMEDSFDVQKGKGFRGRASPAAIVQCICPVALQTLPSPALYQAQRRMYSAFLRRWRDAAVTSAAKCHQDCERCEDGLGTGLC